VPTLAAALKDEARRLGFAAAGITTVAPFTVERQRALESISAGRMDGMSWFTKERVVAATDLAARYPWAQSILALAWPYPPASPPQAARPGAVQGRFAAYACTVDGGSSVDYHDLLSRRCKELVAWLRSREPNLRAKHFVDHGWAMDRAIAERAGVGFTGKNTTLITREAGSYVLLAEILLSVALPVDPPSSKQCGRCRACLPACPTGALLSPGVIDAPRCISYLTIEHKGPIPTELRPLVGTWAFGCDLCQEACPINQRLAPPARGAEQASTAAGPVPYPDLVECLQLSDEEFEARFRGTAIRRAGRAGLARNCAVALGNAGDLSAIPALRSAREHDPDEVVREAAAWALRRLAA
jgi:epoxyqueuosine reductase